MTQARAGAAAVVLHDGRILVTGGSDISGSLATVDVFENGEFSAGQPMQAARSHHAAAVLRDGRVLVAGGVTASGTITNSAEIYDPVTDSWTPVAGGMSAARSDETATVLEDGRVVVAGGQTPTGPTNTLEIFSPDAGAFTTVAATLSAPRWHQAAAGLSDGRVLIVGGSDGTNALQSADVFDPTTGAISSVGNMSVARSNLSATTLLDGTVLLAGGNNGTIDLASAEIYNPVNATFTPTGSLTIARSGQLSILLPNNNEVLILGGTSSGAALQTAELFVPWAGQFTTGGSMLSPRSAPAASLLQSDGQLLVAGGTNGTTPLISGEVYNFATVKTDQSDYPPGTIVNITGSGWQPGETVTLTLVESPLYDSHGPYTAVADSNGNIFNNQFMTDEHDANIRFYLTAKGSASQAQMTFTDSNVNGVSVGTQTPNPVTPGNAASFLTTVTFGGNDNTTCTASLSVTGLPTGATSTFSSSSVSGIHGGSAKSTLTISTAPSNSGTYSFNVVATPVSNCNGGSQTAQGTLVISGTAPAITSANATTFTVGAAGSFTVTATGSPKPTLVISSGNLPSGVTFDGATGILSGTPTTAGTYSITLTATSGGASFSQSFTLTVGKASATVTLGNLSQAYDGTPKAATATTSPAGLNVIFSYNGSSTVPTAAGSYAVVGTIQDNNYQGSGNGTLVVNKALPVVTWANPADISYGTALSSTQLNATATVLGTFVYNPQAGTVLNTGNGQTLSVTFTPNDTADYTPAIGAAQINVLPTTPGIMNSGPGTSTYGASVTLSVTLSAPAGAETPTGTVQFQFTNNGKLYNVCSDGSLQTQPAGTSCTVPLNNGTASVTTSSLPAGTNPDTITAKYTPADSNYQGTSTTISYTVNTANTQTALSITPATGATYGDTITLLSNVTNTATAQGSTVTPTGSVQFQYSTDGGATWVNIGTPVTLDTSANAQTTTTVLPAGQPAVRAQYVPDNDFAASNSVPAVYKVDPKGLTVSGISASNKPYDGKTTATLDTSNAQPAGVIGSDDVHLVTTGATGTFADANAGTDKIVTVNRLSLTGTAKSNYTLSQVTATASITPVQVTVTAPSLTVTYGDPVPAPLTPTYNAFVNGEDSSVLTTQPTCTTTYTPNSAAGSNPTTSCSGAVAMNYTFTPVPGIITVNKANATVTVTGYRVTYDGTAHTATGNVTGVKGEPLNIGLDLSGTTHTNAGSYADTWTFTDSTGNYNNSNGTVTDTIAQAMPTVTVTGGTFTYDTTPHPATTQITGVSGDTSLTSSMVTISYTPGDSAAPVNAGSYSVVGSFPGNQNYKAVSGTATITINKADATVTINGGTYTYDANPHPASVTIMGVKGDTSLTSSMVTINYTPGGINAPVGAGSYSAVGSFSGNGNYNPATSSAAVVTINKANVTVSVTPYSVTYDGTAHTAAGTVTGVKGETLVGLDLSGTTHTNAGSYTNDVWTFADSTGNYNNTSGAVSDVIAKANPTLIVNGGTYIYDENAHPATATLMGITGDASLATATVTITYTPGGTTAAPVNAGSYQVSGSFSGSSNYNPVAGTATITINPAAATISVGGYNGPYDSLPHGATIKVTGVKGEDLSKFLNLGDSFIHVPGGIAAWTFSGDSNYIPASGTVPIVITAAATATTLSSSLSQSSGAATIALTATVTSVPPSAGGTVTFMDTSNNNSVVGTSVLTSGAASVTIPASSLPIGSHVISASYVPPNSDFAPSTSAANSAPAATITAPSANNDVFAVNASIPLSGSFTAVTGAIPSAVWTMTWTMPDTGAPASTTQAGTISPGSTNITGTATFANADVYGFTLTFTDGIGGVVIANTINGSPATIVTYDPSAGFVTGGGWIMSPAGAYTQGPSLAGKATFGFVSKYQKGANVPTGDTQFQFQAGNFNFHSSSYQWLVISGGMAQYKGTGTINGDPISYNFMLTARDGALCGCGKPDGFRIKVTNASGGVIYDNMYAAPNGDTMTSGNTQDLGGGSVIIHSN